MKSIKVDEATDTTLDWLVAKCEGVEPVAIKRKHGPGYTLYPFRLATLPLEYSTKWAQGGPIIERENISLASQSTRRAEFWQADIGHSSKFTQWDHKPLIAAMRCYVMSKLGETVEVPEEILNASHLTN